MKPSCKLLLLLLGTVMFLFSCKKHDYYQVDPNNPSQASPALLLTNICTSTFNGDPTAPAFASRHLTYYERPNVYVNYGWGAASFSSYDILRQVTAMDELAQKTGEENYRGLARFFRAVHFTMLTEVFGDVPYSEALRALQGNDKPKYDTQEDIYVGVLNELEEANTLLDPAKGRITGDIIFGNKAQQILQWKKLVNAYRLRVLMHLSKKEANTRLGIRQQFQDIIGNPAQYPLMNSIDDNGQLVYNTSAINNAYPTFQSLSFASLVALEQGFVDTLKAKKDPRLFSFAEPVTGQPANVFSSYSGVNAGLTVANQQTASQTASKLKRRYIESQVNEPYIFMGYAEQEFLIAEAIARGWVSGAGTAAEHYNNGITASMKFYGISQPAIDAYLGQPAVVFDPASAIPMIIVQKYISFFMNSFWEPFYEQRRTGIQVFNVGPGTLNGGQVPKRWRYPQEEFTINKTNIDAALQRQFSGTDNVNGVMWVLQ